MKKQSLILTLAVAVLVLFACKPPKEFLNDLKVSVNPLESHAGKIEVTIDGVFPVKYFTKNMVLTVTPVLKSKTSDATFKAEPVSYQGQKVKGNNTSISYKLGGKYTQKAVFTYDPAMESSELWLEVEAKIKNKVYTIPAVKVADGVNITPLLVALQPGEVAAKIEKDKFQRIIEERKEAEIKFLIQQSEIRKSEVKSETVVALTKRIEEANKAANLEMKGLEVASYASPDGGMELNEKLADKRDKESVKFINKEFPIDEFGYYVVYGADIDIFSGYIPRGLIGYENYEIEMALRVFINIDFIIDFKPYSFKGRNISVIWISKKDKIIHPNNIKQYSDKNP